MSIERLITIQAIKTIDNDIIPIWDKRISFEKHESYGNLIKVKDDHNTYHNFTEVIYDIKTREISTGIDLDYYPEKTEFVIGEDVLVEDSHSSYYDSKVVDIQWNEFDLSIVKGKELHGYFGKRFEDVETTKGQIYAVKYWKPTYILTNGEVIVWEFELKHKISGPIKKKR